MSVFVTDTHPLLWFTLGQRPNLSRNALRAFEDAESGKGYIYVPVLVLLETAILERQDRIVLKGGFLRWTESLFNNPGFGVSPLEPEIIKTAVGFSFNKDPFDRVIAATAVELSVPLITRDAAITGSGIVEVVW